MEQNPRVLCQKLYKNGTGFEGFRVEKVKNEKGFSSFLTALFFHVKITW